MTVYAFLYLGAHIAMHPPLLTRVTADGGDGFQRKFVVCAHLPLGDQLPEPTRDNVYFQHLPEMTVFVRTFKV